MPSPFPGIDPFWSIRRSSRMSTTVSSPICAKPSSTAAAAVRRGARTADVDRGLGAVHRTGCAGGPARRHLRRVRAAVAVAARPRTQPLVIRVPHDERHEPLIEIHRGRDADRRLVTRSNCSA